MVICQPRNQAVRDYRLTAPRIHKLYDRHNQKNDRHELSKAPARFLLGRLFRLHDGAVAFSDIRHRLEYAETEPRNLFQDVFKLGRHKVLDRVEYVVSAR